jgi:alpha-mannosidase
LLRVEPSDVLVTTLKPSDDGKAWIIRLFGGSGQERPARLVWSSPQPRSVSISDLSEKPGTPVGDTVTVPGWDLVTVRAEF